MVLDGESSEKYPVNAKVLFKTPVLVLHFSYYMLMTFLIMLSGMLLAMLVTLCSNCDQASDLWKQLELTSKFESEKGEWGRKSLFIPILKKLTLFCLTNLITVAVVLLTGKCMGLFWRKNNLLRFWD